MGRKRQVDTGLPETNTKMYWTDVTEAAVVQYIQSDDLDLRETLYRNQIGKALDKMAESIINRFKFPYINMPFDDVKRQVVSFLVCNMHKYAPEKGKSFSYFSVMAKNYLILQNTNGYKLEKTSVSLTSESQDSHIGIEDIVSLEAPDERAHEDVKEFIRLMIYYWDHNLTRIFKKKRDIDIATAIIQLFRDADTLENFNKKALYVMIREMTDCQTGYITKVINRMKEYIKLQMNEYLEYGTITHDQSPFFSYDD
jgi:hypothetical protein